MLIDSGTRAERERIGCKVLAGSLPASFSPWCITSTRDPTLKTAFEFTVMNNGKSLEFDNSFPKGNTALTVS